MIKLLVLIEELGMNHTEFAKDLDKWLDDKLKQAKKDIEIAKQNVYSFGMYDDCGDSYQEDLVIAKEKFDVLLDIKIGIEKYAKKIQHQENESQCKKVDK